MSIEKTLAEFAVSTDSSSIPDSARAIARLSLLDWISVALTGKDEPVSRIVRDMVLGEGGSSDSSVIGSNVKLPARAAALSNGSTSHALDYDDTHFVYLGHPSVAVIPAALAIAEKNGNLIGEFVDACLIGSEVACRIGAWLGREHYQHGFHATATAGSFGAAMAVSRLLALDVTDATYALGLAATRTSGIKAQFGTMGKPFHAGMAAANGVEAATLAAAGFISNPAALDVDQGFGVTHAGENNSLNAISEIGKHYLFESIQHKYHACCHGTHATIEALTQVTNQRQISPENISTVTVTVNPRYLRVCNIREPETGLECKFSLRMTAAMAIARRDTQSMAAFHDELCCDGELTALRDKVEVRTDSMLSETQAATTLELIDGTTVEASHDLDLPIPYADKETKVRDKCTSLLSQGDCDGLWTLINSKNQSIDSISKRLADLSS